MTDPQTAQRHWADTLTRLQDQMTGATFDFCLRGSQVVAVQNGAYQIGVPNPLAVDWLENRLRASINRELVNVTGDPFSIEFIPLPSTLPSPAEGIDPSETQPDGPSAAGQIVASANHYAGFFEKGGSGFSQIPHHTTYFWQNLLGPAFGLWLILTAADKRNLSSPAHWWTPPVERKYVDLARQLNRRHHRYISGDEIECTKSREMRQVGQLLDNPSRCCGSPKYDLLRFKSHPKPGCGLLCLHWKAGLLEILAEWNLVAVELVNGLDAYKFKIQTWRMLPILTPAQIGLFDLPLQDEYRNWLRVYGSHFQIPNVPFWETITDANLVSLMPTHDQPEISHNFDQRRKRQDFLRHAVSNPRYQEEAEEADDDDSN